jgi:predicted 2-oxoglutarate/Fe(II)-dependent dioxygenase YbiX
MPHRILEIFDFLDNINCDQIMNYGQQAQKEQGKLYTGQTNTQLRNNRIVWYKDSRHYQIWTDFLKNFDPEIDWVETPQISYYTPGEYFELHTDQQEGSKRTHIRRLTLTANLQTADGGCIEVLGKKYTEMKKGQAVVFASSCQHRAISPITGERISLTIWGMAKNHNKI